MYRKETLLAMEIIKFTTESLALQNRHLKGAHCVLDKKLLWSEK